MKIIIRLLSIFFIGIVILSLSSLGGCSKGRKGDLGTTDETKSDVKVLCEAYLFDAKLRREGKQTSFRLELFVTDSVAGLNGRAYLGKNALKGRLTADSLTVFFPHSDEYVAEEIGTLLHSMACLSEGGGLNVLNLLNDLPDTTSLGESFSVRLNSEKEEEREYSIASDSAQDCNWRLDVTYSKREEEWRPVKLFFTDGNKHEFTATRREHRPQANISANRFVVNIPGDAGRIIP
ncbi:MAG: hypothetical protein SGI97_04065 [candidate division Zixibacteria bacterium]|nr:hypothetical protein [candidate division Zixibacteria bacterium]